MESTSSSLLLRLRRPGEEAAWQHFIDLYTPLLYFWACRMGLDAQDAADLVQDVFVASSRSCRSSVTSPTRELPHLAAAVAENRWRDALRKRPRRRRTPAPGAGRSPRPGRGVRHVGGGIRRHVLSRAVQIMRSDFEEKTWKACWALVVEGKSGAAVAAELGMKIDAVYAARSRVLRRLRQELDGLMD